MSAPGNDSSQEAASPHQQPTAAPAADPFVLQVPIRLFKNPEVKSNVMRFNAKDFVPIEQWQSLRMSREKTEVQPQQQADADSNSKSNYYRKRFKQHANKISDEKKPWILKINGKKGKIYRGARSGGIAKHVTYYVFNTTDDGAIEAQRLDEFYNFHSISRFTPLTAEEAEREYKRRRRALNLFSIMTRKRLLGEDNEEEEAVVSGGAGAKKLSSTDLKITDMDEWMSSSDCESDDARESVSDNEGGRGVAGGGNGGDVKANDNEVGKGDVDTAGLDDELAQVDKKKKKRKSAAPVGKKGKKTKPEDFMVEKDALEESDDGDDEGREMDYESESSDGELDLEVKCAMKSVAEEDALRKLLTSDSEPDEPKVELVKDVKKEVDKGKTEKNNTDEKKVVEISNKKISPLTGGSMKKCSKSKNKKKLRARKKLKGASLDTATNGNSNEAVVPNGKELLEPSTSGASKQSKPTGCPTDENGHFEEITRRYLARRPFSAVELLHKMKSNYSYLTNEKLLEKVTKVLKKIDPVKFVAQGKLFFSLKKSK